ncbi:hypothetical protein LSH36_687g00018 [Paralvinella palmiformis]|uniref:Uncharacterized protein n=1 Tax=Paralvinella palmiformis TaxID=53620 RepID=A0AAD9MW92_9ANNE|nr:hypothetical protein LSH36_687g00018 [Paralvinella palmiformis]
MYFAIGLSIFTLSLATNCRYAEGLTSKIRVDITCDNRLWFYADGQTIVQPNTPGSTNWRVTSHVSVPTDTKVYGIKCVDFGVVGGIIASMNDGSTTDGSWRCTNRQPSSGWLSENYDDSGWQSAHVIHTNNRPSIYWGVRKDISEKASWIWTNGWKGQDKTVYCRKVKTELPSKIKVDITCDNRLWFYADGQTIIQPNTPGSTNWRVTSHVSVPKDTKVYGIKCVDFGVVGGIIASMNDGSTTDGSWRCTNRQPNSGWLSENYDDSGWQSAHVIHTNNRPSMYWGVRKDISEKASWIWTNGWKGQDKTVYCRKVKSELPSKIRVDITCDNRLWFYADGQTIIQPNTSGSTNWRVTSHVSVPTDTKVYGIKCVDFGVVGGIIASMNDGSTTDGSWRCTNRQPNSGWLSENYDDSDWQSAHVIHTNNRPSIYWGVRKDISENASWIWTNGWKGQDKTVYCRKVKSVPAHWGTWGSWSTCSGGCGTAIQTRRRRCNGDSCPGSNQQTRRCAPFGQKATGGYMKLMPIGCFTGPRSHRPGPRLSGPTGRTGTRHSLT